jgi:hypothetical protein
MPLIDRLTYSTTPRRLALAASLTAGILLVGLTLSREEPEAPLTAAQGSLPPSSATVRSTTTSADVVVARLREVLRIRESAYRSRNPDVLRSIYSNDCPCLVSDETAILELLEQHYVWRGIGTSIEVRSVRKVHDRLWNIIAVFRSEALRIETEGGRLIRMEPAGSNLFKFTMVKPRGSLHWLLGLTSMAED